MTARKVAVYTGHLLRGWLEQAVVAAPVLPVRAVQSDRWAVRWHAWTDTACRPLVQCGAGVWAVGCGWLGGYLLAAFGVVVLAFGAGRLAYPHTARGKARTELHAEGWPSHRKLRAHVSKRAAAERMVPVRPSLQRAVCDPVTGKPSAALIARLPASQFGTWLGTTAVGPSFGVPVYATHEDVVGVIGPPRSGKGALLGSAILDHPGAVLSTQTKAETWRDTSALRAAVARNRQVELLDPDRQTGEKSTFRWNPVRGCREVATAQERAAAFAVAGAGVKDGDSNAKYFADRAAWVLRVLLMSADVHGYTLLDVWTWTADFNPASESPVCAAAAVRAVADQLPRGWLEAYFSVVNIQAEKTWDGIEQAIAGALAFLADPMVAELCCPDDGDDGFDVAEFLANRSTVYLIASDKKEGSAAPLLAAFTSYVFEEAKRIAEDRGGRLDPPLMLNLDEVALTIPMPLDRWVADSGGRGIHIVYACQADAQARQRWGKDGADTIKNCTSALVVYGGLTVVEDLKALSELAGDYTDRDGKQHRRLTVDELRTLPRFHALVLYRSIDATVVRVKPFWLRRDVQQAKQGAPPTPPAPLEDVPVQRQIEPSRPLVTVGAEEETP